MASAVQTAKEGLQGAMQPTLVKPAPIEENEDRHGASHPGMQQRKIVPNWMQLASILRLMPPWVKWPDFNRTSNMSAAVASLWPHMSLAIEELMREQLEPVLRDTVQQQGRGILLGLDLTTLELGQRAPQISGMKAYDYGEDEMALEMAASWASESKFTLAATVKLPVLNRVVQLPVTVQNLQFAAHVRVTAFPVTDQMPFVGSVTATLLDPPHIDFELPATLSLPFLSNPLHLDLLALPFVSDAFKLGVQLASKMLMVYPKGYTYELTPGGSHRPQPAGMLVVRLVKIAGLRSEDTISESDPYCIIQVREGRTLRSRTVTNNSNPEFDEEFTMLVDDPEKQRLRLVVKDEDWGPSHKLLGLAELPLIEAPFMKVPRTKVPFTMQLYKLKQPPRNTGLMSLPGTVVTAPMKGLLAAGRALQDQEEVMQEEAEGEPKEIATSAARPFVEHDYGQSQSQPATPPGGARSEGAFEATSGQTANGQPTKIGMQRSSSNPELTGRGADAPSGEGGHAPHLAGREQRQQERRQAPQHSAMGYAGHQIAGSLAAGMDSRKAGESAGSPAGAEELTQEELQLMQAQEEGTSSKAAAGMRAPGGGLQVMTQLRRESQGTVFLEALYIPFKGFSRKPGGGFGAGIPIESTKGFDKKDVETTDRGILTVTLVKAHNLGGFAAEADPFVRLEVYDPETKRRHIQQSSVIYNEPNPRWDEKFDFIMISPVSKLQATVIDKKTLMEKTMSLKLSKERFTDTEMGRAKVNLSDVAHNGRVRHTWSLRGATRGAVEMVLVWIPCSMAEV